jgi:hypothetical protein
MNEEGSMAIGIGGTKMRTALRGEFQDKYKDTN